jgi:hypothetical protein
LKTDIKERQPGAPVITRTFASREISPGETWKIYLRATDPEGDMERIVCTVLQPGRGTYPASHVGIPKDQRQDLSGFLYLNTGGGPGMVFVNLTLEVQIQDRAGNSSQTASFSLALNPRSAHQSPPPGAFPEKALGPIMIPLEPGTGGS